MRCRRGVEVITALFFAGSDQISCNAGIKHGNSGVIWTGVGGLTISRSRHPFRTAYLCVFTPSYHSRAARTHQCFCVMCFIAHSAQHVHNATLQNRRAVDEQGRRVHIDEQGSRLRKQHSQGGKGTDICSLSFGHSLSLLSYYTSKINFAS